MNILMIDKVSKFAEQMQKELDDNKHKGDWEDWKDVQEMISELEWHKAKLLYALKDGDRERCKEYIADCANILMFIGNTSGLYE